MKYQEQLKNMEIRPSKSLGFFVTVWAHMRSKRRTKYKKERSSQPNQTYGLPEGIEISEQDEKEIRDFAKGGNRLKDMNKSETLLKIYEKNKEQWEKYWERNADMVNNFANSFREQANKFNFDLFKDVAHFFEADSYYPRNIRVYFVLGNKKPKAYQDGKSIFLVLPDSLEKGSRNMEMMIHLFLHELVHVYQKKFKHQFKDNKTITHMIEKTADCFAPKGFFTREHRHIAKDEKARKFYNLIINSFKKGKTVSDIWDKMMELSDVENYT